MAYENIEKLGGFSRSREVGALQEAIAANDKKVAELLKKLAEMEAAENRRRAEAEEAARIAEEAAAALRAEEEARTEEMKKAAQKEEEAAKKEAPPPRAQEPEAVPVPETPAEEPKKAPVAAAKAPAPAPAPRPERTERTERTERPARPAANEQARRPVFRPEQSQRPARPASFTPNPARPQQGAGARPPYQGTRPQQGGVRPQQGGFGRPQTAAPRTPQSGLRPQTPRPVRPVAVPPPAPAAPRRDFTGGKKYDNKTFTERRPVNKRALIKQQGADIGDFDKESGYRKARFGKKVRKETQTVKIDHAVVTTKDIPIKTLSEKLGISAVEIVKRLFREGVTKTVNESVDYDNAAFIALELGIDLEYKPEKTAEETLFEVHGAEEGETAIPRPPVVTVMGHVDHGKTSLLDAIRKTNVTESEAGGITQSIGAYTVDIGEGRKITFIDTPGHAAFTAMRARGAKVTDIVVLVVAADDGIMPQTVEAIDHAKEADVPIIVAMNKMDKPQADPDKVKRGLMNYDLVPEEWGGDVIVVPVSAKTGEGIGELLDSILLQAEMEELTANPDRKARGVVIEAKLDKGKGPVASVLVQNGTLRTGDNLISGTTMGRVRAMIDDKGKTVKEAGPSMAVEVLGLEDVPNAGDAIFAVDQSLMKKVQEERKNKQRESLVQDTRRRALEDFFNEKQGEEVKELKLIIKADVQGSVEAVRGAVEKLSNEEVKVKVIHAAAGAITESDISLADSADAVVIGFNVRPDSKAKTLAERSHVDVKMYRIIYELLDDMEAALKGMLAPKFKEVYAGKAEVKQTFNITGVGTVAGCFVTEGRLVRGGKLRIYRDNIMIVEGNVKQLKRYKDDVKEVTGGMECGCAIEGFDAIRVGDFIECYLIEEIARE